jgi:NDP-sugar pyrophosphorylase family protein
LKAVVLAGGFGTRLRPLSCTRPKLLFPICNRPLLDWTLERLAKSGVKEVVLAVNYMAEAFIQRYGNSTRGMRLFHSREEKPLGTGGPIKNAEKLIGRKEPFLVLNGDILTDFDYSKLMEKHIEKGATATIALYRVADTSRYGIAELTEKNRVVRFVEKPAREKAPSNLANAGIYALDPEIFDYTPGGQPVSIEREVFPKLADEGKLYGYDFEGSWIDIGKREDYLKANKLLLDTQIKKSQLGKSVPMKSDVEIKHPTVVGEKVVIEEKSKVGPYAAVGERTILGKGVLVQNSIIFPGVMISDFTSIKGAIIGENAIIGRHVKVEDGCMIGDHAVIRDNVTLTRGVTVCPSREVSESVLTPRCLM